jgi:adenine-specific DNA-methyltransferase
LFKGAKQSNTADGGLIVQEEINKNKDITANSEQLAALKAQFPSCFDKDGRFRPDKLEDIVRASGADITREGYKLDWLGKSYARLLANLKTETLLAPNAEHNALPENADSENLLIQGDNLDVLKHLVNAYSEKVKMIYIDPPYNTGSDGFVYNDTRKFTVEELQRLAGVEEDEAQRILDFTQSLSNSHSAWLTFMYPRLYVARELLRENGVIFISIDDNEQAQLKLLCDEVFGEENFVAQFVWAAGRKNDSQLVSVSHETILTYVKSRDLLKSQKTKWSQRKRGIDAIYAEAERLTAELESYDLATTALRKWYKNLDDSNPTKLHRHYKCIDEKGVYFPADISWIGGGGPQYQVLHPTTQKPVKRPKRGWMTADEDKMQEWINNGQVHFGKDETTVPCIKAYLKDNEYSAPYSVFYRDGRASSKRLRALMDADIFGFPKDETIIAEILDFATSANESELIIDFFAGSGTAAHAVMALNAQDGGNRKHISVQLDEPTDEKSEARKAGYKTIFEITRERIKRAAAKIREDHPDATCDFGFKQFKTIPANEGLFQGYLDDAATRDDFEPFNGMALDDDAIAALLTTWKAYDGLPLHQNLIPVDLDGYTAYQGCDKLYFVNTGLDIKHIAAMLTRIDDDATFTPRKIVVFHYRFNNKQLREFSEAVNAPNRKHLQLDFIQRF